MTYSERENKEIRELLRQNKSYREIRVKTGASFDKIAQIKHGRLPKPSYPSSTVTTPPGKNPENPTTQAEKITLQNTSSAIEKNQKTIPQESLKMQTDQIINQLLTALETTPRLPANNNHDTDYQRLEERVNQLEQAKQMQERTTNLHPEKLYDEKEADDLKSQQIQSNVLSPNVSDFQQPPKTKTNQTIVLPQDLENERPDSLDYFFDSLPEFVFAVLKNLPALKKAGHELITHWKTLLSPGSNYIQYVPEKTKKPISGYKPVPLLIPNSTSPPKTNKEPAYLIPLGRVEPIQESPHFQKTITAQHISGRSDSNQHTNNEENQKN